MGFCPPPPPPLPPSPPPPPVVHTMLPFASKEQAGDDCACAWRGWNNHGRIRSKSRYSSRIIDIDILLFGDLVMNEEQLQIPHPHLHERRFVLVPLAEIAPDFIHPLFNKSILSLLETCPDKSSVIKL